MLKWGRTFGNYWALIVQNKDVPNFVAENTTLTIIILELFALKLE